MFPRFCSDCNYNSLITNIMCSRKYIRNIDLDCPPRSRRKHEWLWHSDRPEVIISSMYSGPWKRGHADISDSDYTDYVGLKISSSSFWVVTLTVQL